MEFNETFLFIINPAAGIKRNHLVQDMISQTARSFHTKVEFAFTEGPGHAAEIARKELAEMRRTFVVIGGDGTVNETAKELVRSHAALGIIPGGSGNGLARHYGIPLKPYDALQVAFMRKTRIQDATSVNGHLSFNVAGIGLDAHIAHQFGKDGKRGFISYLRLFLKEIPYFRPIRMDFNSEVPAGDYMLASFCTCSQYGNSARICPEADPHDGMTNVVAVPNASVLRSISMAYKLYRGDITREKEVTSFNTDKLVITCNKETPMHIDGEPMGTSSEFLIESKPDMLNLIVP